MSINISDRSNDIMPFFIFFDTETTGNTERDRIIQIGALVDGGEDGIEIFDELCSTDIPIASEAMEVHHIIPEMIEQKPPFSRTRFLDRVDKLNNKDNCLIAHNIDFDLGMLEKEGFINKLKKIDTLRCSKHLFSDLPNHRLQYMRYELGLYKQESDEAKRFDIEVKAHSAIGDVVILRLLFSRLIDEIEKTYKDIDPIEKLIELTNTPVLMKIFKFGKYKGKKIATIAKNDAGYIKWMRNNLDLDEDLAFTLDHYIQ